MFPFSMCACALANIHKLIFVCLFMFHIYVPHISKNYLHIFAGLHYGRLLGHGNDKENVPSQSKIVCVQATGGIIAGAVASCVTTPLDTIKTRLQVLISGCTKFFLVLNSNFNPKLRFYSLI